MMTSQSPLLSIVIKAHERLCLDKAPLIVKSPGRINIIGEHTDYNNGFALLGAVDKSVVLAFTPRADNAIRLHSIDFDSTFETSLSTLEATGLEWPNLVLGSVIQLQRSEQNLSGFDLVYGADLPRSAGLSSSSAIACGVIYGLNKLFDLNMSVNDMAWSAVRTEHEFMGVRCGVMDQINNLRAQENSALLLDCQDQSSQYVPFEQQKLSVVLCDSQVRRKLSLSKYNKRRGQCEEGVTVLEKIKPGIKSLRDISMDFLQSNKSLLNPTVYKRCHFVLEENQRVLKTCEALRNNDLESIKRLLYASHEGLRDLYQVSCAEINKLVDGAMQIKGVYGARLMGAGFGGCTINLVEESQIGTFLNEMTKVFRDKLRKSPKIHVTALSKGTHVVNV
ncbi:MAG: galactokinase [Holophagaceae bacterium]|nr:galactokinase [Holophagaceae bacterium]